MPRFNTIHRGVKPLLHPDQSRRELIGVRRNRIVARAPGGYDFHAQPAASGAADPTTLCTDS